MLNKIIRTFLQNLFIKDIDAEKIEKKLNDLKVKRCHDNVIIGQSSMFYPEATVENLAHNCQRIQIGTNTHIRGHLLIWPYSEGISIGKNSYIGKNTNIWSGEKITIGDCVLISDNVTIIDSDSHELDHLERAESFSKLIAHGHPKQKGNVNTCPIIIENYAWISYGVSILKGVTVGEGAIIGAGSVMTSNIPPYSFAVGNPAQVKKKNKNG